MSTAYKTIFESSGEYFASSKFTWVTSYIPSKDLIKVPMHLSISGFILFYLGRIVEVTVASDGDRLGINLLHIPKFLLLFMQYEVLTAVAHLVFCRFFNFVY